MALRILCLLLITVITSPVFSDDQPAAPASDAPSQTPTPAAANATVEVTPATPDPAPASATSQSADAVPDASAQHPQLPSASDEKDNAKIIEQRVDALLKDPGPMIDRTAVQNQLDDLTTNAFELSNIAADPQLRFDALNLQLQSIYTRLVEYPDASDVDRQLGRLRAAARRIKTINLPGDKTSCTSVGDFWLMTAELYDMNRTKLPLDARKKQAAALMKDFLAKHPDWPAAMDVREALVQLEKKPADTIRASQEQQSETAPATPTSPTPTQPQ